MDNKKILLTGARGFLGKNLLKKLIKMNFNVLEGDIQKRDNSIFLYDDFELSSFDLVVHLGASSSRYDDPNLIFEKNILLTNRILQEAAKVGTKVIFISANSIINNLDGELINEFTQPSPIDLYSSSKLLGEYLLKEYVVKKNRKTIRLPSIYGDKSKNKGLIQNLIKNLKNNDDIEIKDKDSLFNNAAMLEDVSEFILNLIINFKKVNEDFFVLGSKESMSFENIVFYLKERCQSKSNIIYKNNKKNLNKNYILDIGLAQKCGFNSKSMIDILELILEYS